MSVLSLIKPIIGKPDATEDVKIVNAFTAIENWANGNIGASNLAAFLEESGTIAESNLTSALQALVNSKATGLTYKGTTVSVTAKTGESVVVFEKTGQTVTLPALADGAVVQVVSLGVTTTVKTAGGGKNIIGDFIVEAPTITLLSFQHVRLESDGSWWYIVAGEPKREGAYTAWASKPHGTSEEPSSTRPSSVLLHVIGGTAPGGADISISGAGTAEGIIGGTVFGFLLPPGGTWSWSEYGGSPATVVTAAYLIL